LTWFSFDRLLRILNMPYAQGEQLAFAGRSQVAPPMAAA